VNVVVHERGGSLESLVHSADALSRADIATREPANGALTLVLGSAKVALGLALIAGEIETGTPGADDAACDAGRASRVLHGEILLDCRAEGGKVGNVLALVERRRRERVREDEGGRVRRGKGEGGDGRSGSGRLKTVLPGSVELGGRVGHGGSGRGGTRVGSVVVGDVGIKAFVAVECMGNVCHGEVRLAGAGA